LRLKERHRAAAVLQHRCRRRSSGPIRRPVVQRYVGRSAFREHDRPQWVVFFVQRLLSGKFPSVTNSN